MWIGELAERSGVAARTVRFYEDHGLLAPPNRTESGYREYDNETVDRLVFIKSAKSLGLTLDEIDSVLQSAHTGKQPCQRVQAIVTDKLCLLDTQIAQLQMLRERLSRLDPPAGTRATICPMIQSARYNNSISGESRPVVTICAAAPTSRSSGCSDDG